MGSGSYSSETHRTKSASVPKEERYRGDKAVQQTGRYEKWLNPARKPYFESRDIDGKNAMDITLIHDLTGSTAQYREDTFVALPSLNQCLTAWNTYSEQIQIGLWGIADRGDRYELQIGEYEADNRMDDNIGDLVAQNGYDEPEGFLVALWARANCVRADAYEKRRLKGYTLLVLDEEGHPSLTPSELSHAFGKSMIQDSLSPQAVCKMVMAKTHLFILQLGNHSHTVRYWSEAIGSVKQPDSSRIVQLVSPKYIAHTAAAIYALTEGVPLETVQRDLTAQIGAYNADRVVKSVMGIPFGEQLKLRGSSTSAAITVDTDTSDTDEPDLL